MIMSGYEWQGEMPYKEVYFTGMVRDQQRRKMSKSLGNSPDALKLIADFGADGVRFGVLSSSPAGGDLLFDEKLCEQGRNFCNKLWNALRLIKGWEVDASISIPKANELAIKWINDKLDATISDIDSDYASYKLSDMTMKLYSFIWNDFCSWFLEMIKPDYGSPIDPDTLAAILSIYERICITLHPLMPFVTEEIYHNLSDRQDGDDCIVASFPSAGVVDSVLLDEFEVLKRLVSKVRDTRNANQLKPKELLSLYVEQANQNFLTKPDLISLVQKMAFVDGFEILDELPSNGSSFMSDNEKYFLQFEVEINVEEERKRLQSELDYAKGFVQSVEKKLSNERFVQNAPEAVVNNERKKLADGQERVRILGESLAKLS